MRPLRTWIDPVAVLAKLEAGNVPIGSMLCEALHAVRSHLGMEVAFIAEFSEGPGVPPCRWATEHLVLCVGDSNPLEESYCQRVVDGRLPELINDATQLPAALELPVTRELPVGAHPERADPFQRRWCVRHLLLLQHAAGWQPERA